MIDAVEPLSFVIWAVFALAAGMYPLGFMLGSSCSPCCGSNCDTAVEFNRCVKFKNVDTSQPATTHPLGIIPQPLHGFSRAVSQPSEVGAQLVPNEIEVSGLRVALSDLAWSIADGTTHTIVCNVKWPQEYSGTNRNVCKWTINLVGTTNTGTPTPTVFGGNATSGFTATIYSDNVPSSSASEVMLPAVTVALVAEQTLINQYWTLATDSTTDDYITQTTGIATWRETKHGWIIKPRDPGAYVPSATPWIFDHELVEKFLRGEETLPYDSGSTLGALTNGTQWTMEVHDPTQFCGYSLCGFAGGFYRGGTGQWATPGFFGGAVQKTITFQPDTLPATFGYRGTTQPNRCAGQDNLPSITMRLRNQSESCGWYGETTTCQSLLATVGFDRPGDDYNEVHSPQLYSPQRDVLDFYCGDLLWVIEHGPCRNSLTLTSASWNPDAGVYTLGGNNDDAWSQYGCLVSATSFDGKRLATGKCRPLEIEINVQQDVKTGNCYGNQTGLVPAGSHVGRLSATWHAGLVMFSDGLDCNKTTYEFTGVVQQFSGNPSAGYASPGGTFGISAIQWRNKWCENYNPWEFRTNYPYYFVDSNLDCYQFRPTLMTVSNYAEVDPVLPTVTPQHTTAPAEGAELTFTRCCPQTTQTVTIPPNPSRWERVVLVESASVKGATAYVTQAGYDNTVCPFDVLWLTGSVDYLPYSVGSSYNNINGLATKMFTDPSCPIVAEIVHGTPGYGYEQPGCNWSVTTSVDWIIAAKTEEGLLSISIDQSKPQVFDLVVRISSWQIAEPVRWGSITITSRESVATWGIMQMQQ